MIPDDTRRFPAHGGRTPGLDPAAAYATRLMVQSKFNDVAHGAAAPRRLPDCSGSRADAGPTALLLTLNLRGPGATA